MHKKNTFENVYIMHTKVKEFVDVHYKRYVEMNIDTNQNALNKVIDFNAKLKQLVNIQEQIVEIQNFLKDNFDNNLKTHRLLHTFFLGTTESFLVLLDLDIKMFARLSAKALATGKYGYFEYRKDAKKRNIQNKLVLSNVMMLIDENTNTVHINKLPNDIVELVEFAIYLTTDIKEKYYNTPVKDIDYKEIRQELLELHKKVSIFRSNPDSDEMKEMILVITKEFGLLVRDKIDGIEIDSVRQKAVIDNLDILKEFAYETLLL